MCALVVASAAIGGVGLWAFRDALFYVEVEWLGAGISLTRQAIDDLAERNLAVASLVAIRPEVVAAIRTKDRAGLLVAAKPTFDMVKATFGMDNMHFHTPETVTILRMHQPAMFGDDLSQLRAMIVAVNRSGQPRSGLELGVNGLPVRGAVPILDKDGTHIGVVEVGSFITDQALRRVVPQGMDITIYLARPPGSALGQLAPTVASVGRLFNHSDDTFERIAGSSFRPLTLSQDQLRTGMSGSTVIAPLLQSSGKATKRLAEAFALRDWAGTPIGVVQVDIDIAPSWRAFLELAMTFGSAMAGLLVIVVLLALVFGRRLARSINEIGQALGKLTQGTAPSLPQTASQRTDEIGNLAQAAEIFRRAQARQVLLLRELDHRVKNMLALVLALSMQTFRSAGDDPKRFVKDFNGRILALARAHDLVFRAGTNPVDLAATVRAALAPWLQAETNQIRLSTNIPVIPLTTVQTQTLTLVFHELATNATEYGGLSTSGGGVDIDCSVDKSGAARIVWTETGGPALTLPIMHRGFGTRLLERGLAQDLGPGSEIKLAFDLAGLRAVIRFKPHCAAELGPHGAWEIAAAIVEVAPDRHPAAAVEAGKSQAGR